MCEFIFHWWCDYSKLANSVFHWWYDYSKLANSVFHWWYDYSKLANSVLHWWYDYSKLANIVCLSSTDMTAHKSKLAAIKLPQVVTNNPEYPFLFCDCRATNMSVWWNPKQQKGLQTILHAIYWLHATERQKRNVQNHSEEKQTNQSMQ